MFSKSNVRYHVSKDGIIRRCKASKGNCPLGENLHVRMPTKLDQSELNSNVHSVYNFLTRKINETREENVESLTKYLESLEDTPETIKIEGSEPINEIVKEIERRKKELGHPPQNIKYYKHYGDDNPVTVEQNLEIINSEPTAGVYEGEFGFEVQGAHTPPPVITPTWKIKNKYGDEEIIRVDPQKNEINYKWIDQVENIVKDFPNREEIETEIISDILAVSSAAEVGIEYIALIKKENDMNSWHERPLETDSPVLRNLDYKSSHFNVPTFQKILDRPEFLKRTPNFGITIREENDYGGTWELKRDNTVTNDPWSIQIGEKLALMDTGKDYTIDFAESGFTLEEAGERSSYIVNLSKGVDESLRTHKENVIKKEQRQREVDTEEKNKKAHEDTLREVSGQKKGIFSRLFN